MSRVRKERNMTYDFFTHSVVFSQLKSEQQKNELKYKYYKRCHIHKHQKRNENLNNISIQKLVRS